MKRLAFVMSDLSIGGQSRVLLDILRALNPDIYDITLFYFVDGPFSDLVPANVKKIRIDFPSWMQHIPFSVTKHFWKQPHLKQAGRFDLAIDFSSYWNGCAAVVNHLDASARIVWIHSDLYLKRVFEWKYKLAWLMSSSKFKSYDHAICVSDGVANAFRRLKCFNANRITVLPNLIDTDRIDILSRETPVVEPDADKINLVFLGRLSKVKRCDMLLNEFLKASKTNSNLRLYMIGDGPERPRLMKQAGQSNLLGLVHFVGAIPNPYPLLSRMDALVLCSEYEGHPIVVLEAKHFGLDLLITKNLEPYNVDVSGVENLGEAMQSARKKGVKAPAQIEGQTLRLNETLSHIMKLTPGNKKEALKK